ncbi:MAG: hypothetical protein WKF35_04020 [Ferruginibacter sp.]
MNLLQINVQDLQVVVTFISAIGIIWMLAEFMKMKEAIKQRAGINNETLLLKLQAYERLTVFSERTGLKNLVGRMALNGESAASLHASIITEIKNEFEYNTSQQIYVTPEIWNAVTKLKDQNIYIINQLAAGLPPQANAIDLSKHLLQYSMSNNAELHSIVLDAIQFEAKKLM